MWAGFYPVPGRCRGLQGLAGASRGGGGGGGQAEACLQGGVEGVFKGI